MVNTVGKRFMVNILHIVFQTAEITASVQAEERINCVDFYNVRSR